jgi:glycosyltransferase involved in cell wall biosynthesis/SAM-dependent methyltransferase
VIQPAEEREKWDRYYGSLVPGEEWPSLLAFNDELIDAVGELLPEGGRILEAGCGGGWQSLALARTGRYQLTMLDFSSNALEHARALFAREGVAASFLHADLLETTGRPEFDLVFNAGVLEHYSLAQQALFLRKMAAWSRRLVVVLVPNARCYWYWVWRVSVASRGQWQYGEEVPVPDQREVVDSAGLHFIGQALLGASWTEEFVTGAEGLEPALRETILATHRSGLIPHAGTAYLVATAASVIPVTKRTDLRRWKRDVESSSFSEAQLAAQVADSLALRLTAEHERMSLLVTLANKQSEVVRLTSALNTHERVAQALEERTAEQARQLELLERRLVLTDQERTRVSADLVRAQTELTGAEAQVAALRAEATRIEARAGALAADLNATRGQLQGLATLADERQRELAYIKSGLGWKMLRRLWRIRIAIAPRGSAGEHAIAQLKRGLAYGRRHGPGRLLARAWSRLGGTSRRMDWYAYAFDRYKRERLTNHTSDLSALRCPTRQGLVSIVLPVYNGADLVREALDSILAQTYQDFELIAVDDGSTDDTGAILDEYARRDPRVRVHHQENQKLPGALTRGFRMASGEFLTWTSCDNRLKPEFLERMVDCLRRHPDWDFTYANIDIIDETGVPLRQSSWYSGYQRPAGSEHVFLPEDPSLLNTWANNYIGGAFLYRDRVAWLIGDYASHRFTLEDYDYWMRVNALLTVRHTDFTEPVYEYRFHSRSLTHRDEELGITRRRDLMMVFEEFRRDFYLSPLVWLIHAGPTGDDQRIADALASRARRAGHEVISPAGARSDTWPEFWVPVVYVRVGEPVPLPASTCLRLPDSTLRVLVHARSGAASADASEPWDLCVMTADEAPVPRQDPRSGWVGCSEPDAVFTALDVKARSHHCDTIEAAAIATTPASLRASVVLCTHRRTDRLEQALASVVCQTLDPAAYEVVVVDNNRTDAGVEGLVADVQARASRAVDIRYVSCPIPGLSSARNAGIAASRGEILCFLDDDAVAGPTWLQQIVEAFDERPSVGVIGGHIRLRIPEPRPSALEPGLEPLWSQFITGYPGYTEVDRWWEFPWGANWSARRTALLKVGGFRTRYGRKEGDFGGGEEVVAASLIKRLGYAVAVLPSAEVEHDVDPRRFTPAHVRQTIRAATIVNYRAQRDLYFPLESSAWMTGRALLSTLARAIRPGGGDATSSTRPGGWRVLMAHLFAKATLLRYQMRDHRHRARNPISRV